ncbi:MAG: hypothetical protein CYG59_19125 [Chloroflexi bacterium]|nr:MAG: hypothetical protein CYG59_19125 [Chloroflexota bacterium]
MCTDIFAGLNLARTWEAHLHRAARTRCSGSSSATSGDGNIRGHSGIARRSALAPADRAHLAGLLEDEDHLAAIPMTTTADDGGVGGGI